MTISSDNSNFNVTPTSIETLPGLKSINTPTVTQVIELDVIHGSRIYGIGVTYIPGFYFSATPGVYMKNTGNAIIGVTLINAYPTTIIGQIALLNPNDTINLKLPVMPNASTETFIELNSNGNIFNQQKFGTGSNGNGYFVMININPSQNNPPNDTTKILRTVKSK